MAQIFLKAVRDPLEVSNERARQIKDDWGNNRLPDVVKIDGYSFGKNELKMILTDDQVKEDTRLQEEMASWVDDMKEMRAWTSDKKAVQSLDVLNACLACFVVSQEYNKEEVKQEFKEFFDENPKRIYPEWDLIKKNFPKIKNFKTTQTSNMEKLPLGEQTMFNISLSIIEDKKFADGVYTK